MSTQTYRDQVTRLVSELGSLETKLAKAREEAARERSAAGRAINSITRSTSASTVQSRLREAERHEARAVTADKEAARLANLFASKQKARSDAERRLANAETSDRKKLASDADRRRRDDLRHIGELERARRANQAGAPRWTVNVQPEVTLPTSSALEHRLAPIVRDLWGADPDDPNRAPTQAAVANAAGYAASRGLEKALAKEPGLWARLTARRPEDRQEGR